MNERQYIGLSKSLMRYVPTMIFFGFLGYCVGRLANARLEYLEGYEAGMGDGYDTGWKIGRSHRKPEGVE